MLKILKVSKKWGTLVRVWRKVVQISYDIYQLLHFTLHIRYKYSIDKIMRLPPFYFLKEKLSLLLTHLVVEHED